MAGIYYPPPPPFMGGRQPLESRELPPSFTSAPPDDPPRLGGMHSVAMLAVIASAWQPAPPPPQASRHVPVEASAVSENQPPFGLRQTLWPILDSWQPGPTPPWERRWSARFIAATSIADQVNDPPFGLRQPLWPIIDAWQPAPTPPWNERWASRFIVTATIEDAVNDPPFGHLGRNPLASIIDQWQPDLGPQKQQWRHIPVSVDDPPIRLLGPNLNIILGAWEPALPMPQQRSDLPSSVVDVETARPPFSHRGRNALMTIVGMWQREWVTVDAYSVVTLGRANSPDALRFYFTNAASDGGVQAAQASCLGGFRSATEATRVGFFISTPIPNVQVVTAARFNGVQVPGSGLGVGTIYATGPNTLAYVAPGNSTLGTARTILNGETLELVDATTPSKWVRVTRTSAAQLAGGSGIEFLDLFNNVVGMSNAADAESSAGGNRYRSIMLRNDNAAQIVALQLYIKPLISVASVSSTGQLSGSGAGTITGATDAFCGWPFKGWAQIRMVGGSLREAVYYSIRTDTALTVPALGRARLGSLASAGTNTDSVWAVPGIRIGFEPASPRVNGSVQTIANESTAPASGGFTGGGWSLAITPETGIQVGTLNPQEQGSLWVHRELPAGVSAIAMLINSVGVRFDGDGTPFDETLAGCFRVADDDIERYEIHISAGVEPDLSSPPTEVTATLPFDTVFTMPASTKVFVAVNRRNRYDLVSQNMATTVIEVDGTFTEITPAPIAPTIILWEAAAGGTGHLLAEYDYTAEPSDAAIADNFRIYLTTNGADPTTADLLATVPIPRFALGRAFLDYTTGAYAHGTTLKVKVATYRSTGAKLSALSATATIIASTAGGSTPTGVIGQRKNFLQDQT